MTWTTSKANVHDASHVHAGHATPPHDVLEALVRVKAGVDQVNMNGVKHAFVAASWPGHHEGIEVLLQ